MSKKFVYLFSEGNGSMRELLGGKGANLAEMTGPPGPAAAVPPPGGRPLIGIFAGRCGRTCDKYRRPAHRRTAKG